MTFPDAQLEEARGDGLNRLEELGKREAAAGGGVDEGGLAMMGMGGDKCGDVKAAVGWKWKGLAFAVECRIGGAEATSWIDS